jgi:hypothetical protein
MALIFTFPAENGDLLPEVPVDAEFVELESGAQF